MTFTIIMILGYASLKSQRCIFSVLVYACKNIVKTSGFNPSFILSVILLLAGDLSINHGPEILHNMHCVTSKLRYVRHKLAALSDLIISKHTNIMAIRETWLSKEDTESYLADITPPGFSLHHNSCLYGGVAFIVSDYVFYRNIGASRHYAFL